MRAQIYRDRGDLKKADAEFRWFVKIYSRRSDNDKDIKDPEELVLVRKSEISDYLHVNSMKPLGPAIASILARTPSASPLAARAGTRPGRSAPTAARRLL